MGTGNSVIATLSSSTTFDLHSMQPMSTPNNDASSLRSWFASKLSEQGLGGLESVYDYVVTLNTADEIRSYMTSFLGDTATTRLFAKEYLKRRNLALPGPLSLPKEAGLNVAVNPKRSTEDASQGRREKCRKEKQNKQRSYGGTTRNEGGSKEVERVVGKAEVGRRRMRQWMKNGGSDRVINCLSCGRIHRAHEVRKDGVCVFCKTMLFEEWEEIDSARASEAVCKVIKGRLNEDHGVDDAGADIDPWLSPEERKDAAVRRSILEDKRRNRTLNVDIDIQTRQITETTPNPEVTESSSNAIRVESTKDKKCKNVEEFGEFRNPLFAEKRPLYMPSRNIDWIKLSRAADVGMHNGKTVS